MRGELLGRRVDPSDTWRSETGAEGTAPRVMVDLTDEPSVVVDDGLAFRISAQDAAAIRDALCVAR